MIDKILYSLLPHPFVVYADGYDLSDKFISSGGSFTSQIMEFASNVYWLFMFISIVYFGYKVITALNVYADRSVHPIQQVQALHEIMEPAKGLIFLDVGIIALRLVIGVVYPEAGNAIRTSTMASFIKSILGVTDKDDLIHTLVCGGINLAFYIFALSYGVKTVISLIQSFKADSATESEQFKQQAKKNLLMTAVGVFGVLIVNLVLSVLGFGGIFYINN